MTDLPAHIATLPEKLRLTHGTLSRLSQAFYKAPSGLPLLDLYRASLTLEEGQGLHSEIELAGQLRQDLSKHDEIRHAALMDTAKDALRQAFDILRQIPVLAGPSLTVGLEYALIGGRDVTNKGYVLTIDHMRLPIKSATDDERLAEIAQIITELARIPGDPAQTGAYYIQPKTHIFGPCTVPAPSPAAAVLKYAILQNPGLLQHLDDPQQIPGVAQVVDARTLVKDLACFAAAQAG